MLKPSFFPALEKDWQGNPAQTTSFPFLDFVEKSLWFLFLTFLKTYPYLQWGFVHCFESYIRSKQIYLSLQQTLMFHPFFSIACLKSPIPAYRSIKSKLYFIIFSSFFKNLSFKRNFFHFALFIYWLRNFIGIKVPYFWFCYLWVKLNLFSK